MSSQENPNVARIRGISDPMDRAAQAQTFIANGRATLAAMQQVRDDAIRDARRSPARPTIDAIATYIKAKRNVIVDALRGHN